MRNTEHLSFQEQLEGVKGKVPVVTEVEPTKIVAAPVVEVLKPVAAPAPKPQQQKQHKPHQPKPIAVEQKTEVTASPVQNTDRQERPVLRISLSELRFIDLAYKVKKSHEAGLQCQFALHQGPASAIFNLSCVGWRVKLCVREATGVYAQVYRKGVELFQDEIFPRDETVLPPDQRLAGTSVFRVALQTIEAKYVARRAHDAEMPKALSAADKQQPGFRSKFGDPSRRNKRSTPESK